MQIFLRDRNPELAAQWSVQFRDKPEVHISCGDIFSPGPHMEAEALVSPANSFGFMDGGIDQVYSDYFGWGLMEHLQKRIAEDFMGEIPVGQAETVVIPSRKDAGFGFLICAPTMRVPDIVAHTVNAYLAFRAALISARRNGIQSILCPGLGTAVGRMPYARCALQMREAYDAFHSPRAFKALHDASRVHGTLLR